MQMVSTILVGERYVTFQQSMLEIHKYAFMQEPKTSSESLEKRLNEMEWTMGKELEKRWKMLAIMPWYCPTS